jgi:hypothetical protein
MKKLSLIFLAMSFVCLVKVTDIELVNRIPVVAKMPLGHVDNSSYPLINVGINMILVVPINVKGPVPAQPSPDDMEKLNDAFKAMMIKADPSVKETCTVLKSFICKKFCLFYS